jgi:pantetheine-phosphate adenylyltransferase
MAQMNHGLAGIETLFVTTNPLYSYLSSSLVKEVATYGGDVQGLIPSRVHAALMTKLAEGADPTDTGAGPSAQVPTATVPGA